MKYAITGHTSGIGKFVFDKLSPDCLGFSKSTGFDITRKADRKRIIDASRDVDVFINSATDGMGQTQLLIELFYTWQKMSKRIINVGSRIAEYDKAIINPQLLSYQAEKIILKDISLKLHQLDTCKVDYVWFGYVGTEKILAKYPHFVYPNDFITEEEACNIILN